VFQRWYSFQLRRGRRVLFRSVISADWVNEVYRKGLAVLADGLVLGSLERGNPAATGLGPIVLVCKPRRGTKGGFARRFVQAKGVGHGPGETPG
jgi:hypothetical protein